MIKAIAIDDEPLALKIVERFCEQTPDIQLMKSFTSQDEAEKYLAGYPVDLIFLDIQMPNLDGISFYKKLPVKLPVIFTTAHDIFAVEGFNMDALDYLLKPYSYERFARAVAKAEKWLGAPREKEEDYLFLRADYQLHKILLDDILYIQSDDDYIRIFLSSSRPKLFRNTLKEIRSKLPANRFLRIHRSYIINASKIQKVASKSIFIQDQELPLSSLYEAAVRKALQL